MGNRSISESGRFIDPQRSTWLPQGQAQAFQSNTLVTADQSGKLTGTNTLGLNLHVINPDAGPPNVETT